MPQQNSTAQVGNMRRVSYDNGIRRIYNDGDGDDGNGEQQDCQMKGRRLLRNFTQSILKRIISILLIITISTSILYGIPLSIVNIFISPSQTNQSSQTNIILQIFLKSSTLSYLYLPQQWVMLQSGILFIISIILSLLILSLITHLTTILTQYKQSLPLQQSYFLCIKLKQPLNKSQTKTFIQYFQQILSKCIKQKIFTLTIIQQIHNHSHFSEQICYLQAMVDKLTLIKDVIILVLQNQNQPLTSQISQLSSQHILVTFSYPQIKQILTEWYLKPQHKQQLVNQIITITTNAPSPQQLLLQKLSNSKQYTNKHKHYKLLIILTVIIQLTYVGILSFFIYLQQFPQHFLSQNVTLSYSQNISYVVFSLQVIVITCCIIAFNQFFIPNVLIKAIPNCISLTEQLYKQSVLNILLLIGNLIVVPVVGLFVMEVGKNGWVLNKNNVSPIISKMIWGELQYGYIIICYIIIKCIIYQLIKLLISIIKTNCLPNSKNQQSSSNSTINQLHFLLHQFAILFTLSIFIDPIIILLLFIGLIFRIREFIVLYEGVNYERVCLKMMCGYFIYQLKVFLFLIIGLGCFAVNGLLLGYGYGEKFINQYYPIIVNSALFLTLFILLIILLIKPNLTKCLSTKCNILLPIFPTQQFLTIMQSHQNQQQNQLSLNENDPTHKQKLTANLLIKRIYTNQFFLYTYNQQLRKHTYFTTTLRRKQTVFQMTRQSTNPNTLNKITQQLNTMSRSLQQTLKQRLLTNSTNPFQLKQTNQIRQQQQLDEPQFEIKVNMRHTKPKTVRVPKLFLPSKQDNKQEQKLIRNNTGQQLVRYNTNESKNPNNNNNKKLRPLKYHPNQLKNTLNKNNESLQQCDILSSLDKNQDNFKNVQVKIQDELYHRKIKFTDLFDSDQQSIKQLVKKKIRLSIPKIEY